MDAACEFYLYEINKSKITLFYVSGGHHGDDKQKWPST